MKGQPTCSNRKELFSGALSTRFEQADSDGQQPHPNCIMHNWISVMGRWIISILASVTQSPDKRRSPAEIRFTLDVTTLY